MNPFKTLAGAIAFSLGLSLPASGEVKVRYAPSPLPQYGVPLEKRAELTATVKRIAGKFMAPPYADRGACDFNGKVNVNVTIMPFGNSDDQYHKCDNTITIRYRPTADFESILLHELTHAYLYQKKEWSGDDVVSEGIPTEKEYLYLEEIKDRLPPGYHRDATRIKNEAFRADAAGEQLRKGGCVHNPQGTLVVKNTHYPFHESHFKWYRVYVNRPDFLNQWEDTLKKSYFGKPTK